MLLLLAPTLKDPTNNFFPPTDSYSKNSICVYAGCNSILLKVKKKSCSNKKPMNETAVSLRFVHSLMCMVFAIS